MPSGIEWDTSKHWSKRAKIALEMYGDDQATLEAIMAVETKGVITAIQKVSKKPKLLCRLGIVDTTHPLYSLKTVENKGCGDQTLER